MLFRSPACTGWQGPAQGLVVALAGGVWPGASAEQLLTRFGAVSAMAGIRYWSVSDRGWRVLVTESGAVGAPDGKARRGDFSAAELSAGRDLYFAQRDSRSSGDVIYRMRVRESTSDRLVVEVENVSPVRSFFVTVIGTGEMKSLYFLDRRGNGSWGLYALLSVNNTLPGANDASYVNRAVAFYRHFSGVATDGAPPLAP